MLKLSLRDLTHLRNQRVLVRVDFNVPLDAAGKVTDDTRICEALPTIEYLLEAGAKVILLAHFGRPKGKREPTMSLRPVAQHLSEILARPVAFVDDCISKKVEDTAGILQPGDCLLLENVRYYAEEEKNDPAFAAKLAALGDIYVNDAFGTAHRAHATTVGIPEIFKKQGKPAAAGFLMEKELKFLGEELAHPERPFLVLLGGAKVSDKIAVIEHLLGKADAFLIGGAMAYTLLKSRGVGVGASLVENDKLALAKSTLDKANARKVHFHLPADHLVVRKIEATAEKKFTHGPVIEDGWIGVDIGLKTQHIYRDEIAKAKTIVWNGPMGVFEVAGFDTGTFSVARAVAEATRAGAKSIIGGGDSVTAVRKAGVADQITFISTGGGASLEFLEGKELPGIAALTDKTEA